MMISKFAILKIIAPSAYLNKRKLFSKKSLVFGDILHNNFSIGYILCNIKSSCTPPFTEYTGCAKKKERLFKYICKVENN